MEEKNEHYIYFLKLNQRLTDDVLHLSRELRKWDIFLIPISVSELSSMALPKTQFIIALNKDLESKEMFDRFRHKYLDFALQRRVFCLFDISSFSKIPQYYRLEKVGSYIHFPLPVSLRKISEMIMVEYLHRVSDERKWPGGRRVKVPELGP